ncbi:MAG: ParB/RepB/Spo0J family partition protein [Anaerolineae bacterium]|nr:ParB/RepB/Spo0J family partition protein [Anaerolineae bacterium]
MSKKPALGRGLGALIPVVEEKEEPAGDGLRQVPVDAIAPNPHQPRQTFDPDALAELAASIKEHGVIQPLIVTSASSDAAADAAGQYVLIAGERRLQAARLAGLSQVPAIIQEATPQQQLELALVENIQRADLNPLEEAAAYQQLVDEFGLTQQEVADRVGRGRVSVANALRLLRLPDFVKNVLVADQISEGHARALLGLEDDQEAIKLVLKRVIGQRLSVRQTEELVRRLSTAPASPKATRTVPPETRALEAEFARSLGTKVNLSRSKKGGRLTIHFYSEDDLQRLYDLLVEQEM